MRGGTLIPEKYHAGLLLMPQEALRNCEQQIQHLPPGQSFTGRRVFWAQLHGSLIGGTRNPSRSTVIQEIISNLIRIAWVRRHLRKAPANRSISFQPVSWLGTLILESGFANITWYSICSHLSATPAAALALPTAPLTGSSSGTMSALHCS